MDTEVMSKKRTILVTGGAGFLGSHLVRRFAQSGHKCLVVDNLFRGSLQNLANVPSEHFEFFNVDMAGDGAVAQLLDIFYTYKPSLVLHYAAVNGTKEIANNRDIIAKKMTPAEIEKAQELARQCVAKMYKGC